MDTEAYVNTRLALHVALSDIIELCFFVSSKCFRMQVLLNFVFVSKSKYTLLKALVLIGININNCIWEFITVSLCEMCCMSSARYMHVM